MKMTEIYDYVAKIDPTYREESRADIMRGYRSKFSSLLSLLGLTDVWPKDRQGGHLVPAGWSSFLQWIMTESIDPDSPVQNVLDARRYKVLPPFKRQLTFNFFQSNINIMYCEGKINELLASDLICAFETILRSERSVYEQELEKALHEFFLASDGLPNTIEVGQLSASGHNGEAKIISQPDPLLFKNPEDVFDAGILIQQSDFLNGLLFLINEYTKIARSRAETLIEDIAEIKDIAEMTGTAQDYVRVDGSFDLDYIQRDMALQKYIEANPKLKKYEKKFKISTHKR